MFALAVTAVASIALIAHHSAHSASMLLRVAESQNSALARALSNEIWIEHGSYLASVRQTNGDALRALPETKALDEQVRKLVHGLPVLNVKIYNSQGLTIYSSDKSQIGESKSDNEGLQKAVRTGAPVSQASYRGEFAAFSGMVADVDLAESYVPIVFASGVVGAIFELYTDITPHVAQMRQDNLIQSALTLAGALITYLAMLLGVCRADAILRRQHEQLTQANVDLVTAHAVAERLNASLQEKIGQLERSNRDLKDFAHVAAHDMQEPLRKIEAFGQRLVTRYGDRLPEDGRMFVERMNDAATRMRRLITDLLAYARLNKEGQTFSAVDLNTILSEVLADLHVRIEETGADVSFAGLPTIEANPAQMRQLVQNLVANALKFTRPGVKPVIRIAGEILQGEGDLPSLQLTVSDNGVGFDRKSTEKLFKLFQRLHGRTEYEGTGVGLATCRRIAENHKGVIAADGVLGEGATFTVRLPFAQTPSPHLDPARSPPAASPASALAPSRSSLEAAR
ncbi:MAG: ATP-binding protein [Hyphomicrobiaceae bacterium]|nr:ATP-binding protein [Hyphomicrobiaceae bacterium]